MRSCVILAGVAATGLSACGGGARQDANEPSGTFPVQVTSATFPTQQRLSQHTHLVIAIRNSGRYAIPNIAVTITDPSHGTAVSAFGQSVTGTGLASKSRPVWIVDTAPGACQYSCKSGGPGGAVTAYANTWAMGTLRPGQTATFNWAVTAVSPGIHTIRYEVAAGLNGKAKARTSGGVIPSGKFLVNISHRPAQAYVNNSGKVVTHP